MALRHYTTEGVCRAAEGHPREDGAAEKGRIFSVAFYNWHGIGRSSGVLYNTACIEGCLYRDMNGLYSKRYASQYDASMVETVGTPGYVLH